MSTYIRKIFIMMGLGFLHFGPVQSAEEGIYSQEPSAPPFYRIRFSTQAKSSAVQQILLEDRISFYLRVNENDRLLDENIDFIETINNQRYLMLGKPNLEEVRAGLNQRIDIGQINVSREWEVLSVFMRYQSPQKNALDACLCHKSAQIDTVSLLDEWGRALSAIRIDLDLNGYPQEGPLRGTLYRGYNKQERTRLSFSDYDVGGEGISGNTLDRAQSIVNQKIALRIPLGESRRSAYAPIESSEENDNFWASDSQIMFAGAMVKEVARLKNQQDLTPSQIEVVLKYLAYTKM